MSASLTRAEEVDWYVTQVRDALATVPEHLRDDLLDDLPTHLAEVAASSADSLESQLGPPDAYAAELCSSAGVERVRSGVLHQWLTWLDSRVGRWLGYHRFTELLIALTPAWWIARGALIGIVGTFGLSMPDPIVRLAALIGAVVSVRVGRATPRFPTWGRVLVVAVNVALAILLVRFGLYYSSEEMWLPL